MKTVKSGISKINEQELALVKQYIQSLEFSDDRDKPLLGYLLKKLVVGYYSLIQGVCDQSDTLEYDEDKLRAILGTEEVK